MCPATMRQSATYRYLVAWWSQKPSSCALVPLLQPCCKHGCCNDRGMRQLECTLLAKCGDWSASKWLLPSSGSFRLGFSCGWSVHLLSLDFFGFQFPSMHAHLIIVTGDVICGMLWLHCDPSPCSKWMALGGWETKGTTTLERRRIWRFPLLRYSITAENS